MLNCWVGGTVSVRYISFQAGKATLKRFTDGAACVNARFYSCRCFMQVGNAQLPPVLAVFSAFEYEVVSMATNAIPTLCD